MNPLASTHFFRHASLAAALASLALLASGCRSVAPGRMLDLGDCGSFGVGVGYGLDATVQAGASAEGAELFPKQVGVRPRADEGKDENVVANEVDESSVLLELRGAPDREAHASRSRNRSSTESKVGAEESAARRSASRSAARVSRFGRSARSANGMLPVRTTCRRNSVTALEKESPISRRTESQSRLRSSSMRSVVVMFGCPFGFQTSTIGFQMQSK